MTGVSVFEGGGPEDPRHSSAFLSPESPGDNPLPVCLCEDICCAALAAEAGLECFHDRMRRLRAERPDLTPPWCAP